jgi:iron complex transport system ATP-binding protein
VVIRKRSLESRLTSQSISVAGAPGPGQPPALRLRDVQVWRWHAASGSRKALLDGIAWDVGFGERWALLGPNGAGKTTLLTLAGAVEFASRGTVEILGETMGRTDVARLREAIGFVDARIGHQFAPLLTVRQVIRTGATATIGYFEERLSELDLDRADGLLGTFGLGPLGERRFGDCSQGERKRALIARALVTRPRLLLLDEPGAGLDLPGRELLLASLDRLAADQPQLAIVITTHHLEELPASTSHALLLRNGQAVASGPVAETLADEPMSSCFGISLTIARTGGRFSASSA